MGKYFRSSRMEKTSALAVFAMRIFCLQLQIDICQCPRTHIGTKTSCGSIIGSTMQECSADGDACPLTQGAVPQDTLTWQLNLQNNMCTWRVLCLHIHGIQWPLVYGSTTCCSRNVLSKGFWWDYPFSGVRGRSFMRRTGPRRLW